MISFYLAAGLLTVVALCFVVWPLLRGQQKLQSDRRQANRLIYQQRLETIDSELSIGRLNTEQAQALRDDAGRLLLGDLEMVGAAADAPKKSRRAWPSLLVCALLLPLISITFYLQSDSWRLIDQKEGEPAWGFLFHKIDARLAINPDDAEALLMLARSRRATQEIPASLDAYTRLNAVTRFANAETLTDEAEIRMLVAEGGFSEVTEQRLAQALAVNPNYGRALWYAGLAAVSKNDKAVALKHWQALAKQELPPAFRKVLVQQLIALGMSSADIPQTSAVVGKARIQLQINAVAELIQGLPGETPVFVLAKPASGGRAMLAVRKHRLDELPLTTELTDGMNMAGGPQLSDYDAWHVVVRVAPSGDALPKSGDPFAEMDVTQAQSSKPVDVQINKRWP